MNFYITGYGRSGTKFLANILNVSPSMTVKHEGRGNKDKSENLKNIQQDFQQPNYAEVNSYLRFYIEQLDIPYGLILRNPIDIFISTVNRHPTEQVFHAKSICVYYSYFIFKIFNCGIPYFSFPKMISSATYIKGIVKELGLTDLNIHKMKDNMTPLNQTTNRRIFNLNQCDLPKVLRSNLENIAHITQGYL